MSQVHLEQPNFPWVILVLATISGVLLYKIALWIYEYGLWIWNNRGGERGGRERSRKSKKHSSSKKKARSPSPDSSSSSDSDSSD